MIKNIISTIGLIVSLMASQSASAMNKPVDVVASFFAEMSGPAGKKRSAESMISHFHPEARYWFTKEGSITTTKPAERFPSFTKWLEKNGFQEDIVSSSTEIYGKMAHVFVVYEISRKNGSKKRGLDSVQMAQIDGEWKILSMYWHDELPERPLEAEFNKDSAQ